MIDLCLKSVSEIYLDLISQAEEEKTRALAEYEDCLNRYCAARMIEFAAGGDAGRVLLEQEKELLREEEIVRLRERLEFWHLRLERLKSCSIGAFRRHLDETDEHLRIPSPDAIPPTAVGDRSEEYDMDGYRHSAIA
ncbi:MAG TPA: hypothetical protein GX702_10230 [Chloroflexi bacterium]|jgi:hypothetical protein|nr:hypothetical protein [Chloroflexota bacterium]